MKSSRTDATVLAHATLTGIAARGFPISDLSEDLSEDISRILGYYPISYRGISGYPDIGYRISDISSLIDTVIKMSDDTLLQYNQYNINADDDEPFLAGNSTLNTHNVY